MRFGVWAPNARRVQLLLDGSRSVELESQPRGWWRGAADATHGTRYQFVLEGGEPLPDPRSPHQPEGVFGPSAVVDHAAFSWSDAAWQPPPLASGLIYELHVGTFTSAGTFDAAIERLDHLVALGVTHVELMPVNEFAGTRGWGYDGVLLFAPHHAYGGPEGLKRLVNACHARGLAVLMDVVYNHFGPEGNFTDRFGPYTTDRYHGPWGDGVNFDGPGSDEVRRYFCDNAAQWIRDYHCDGLRLDAIHAIRDTTARSFLEQLTAAMDALSAHLGRSLAVTAESALNDPRVIREREAGGYGFTAHWNDDFHHAVQVTLVGNRDGYYADFAPWSDLTRSVERGYVYEGQYSAFHDRSHGRPLRQVEGGRRLIAFLQNHDQIGNHSHGRRMSAMISPARQRVAAALLFTAPFIPLLFQGEEWGAHSSFPYFCEHLDPALIRSVREGRQREFGQFGGEEPDPQAVETFAAARLCWDEIAKSEHHDLLDWYRRLIAIRRGQPDLTDGNLARCVMRCDAAAAWLTLERGRVRVAANLSARAQAIPCATPITGYQILASSGDVATDAAGSLILGPEAVVIASQPQA